MTRTAILPRIILMVALLALPFTAHAACSTPVGRAGETIFNTTTKTMQYCNNTNWVNTGTSLPGAGSGGCSSPSGVTGQVIYNGALGVVQFCNGDNWIDTACAASRTPGGSGCTGPAGKAGQMIYEATSNELQFCDSTNWVAMGWPCGAAGLVDWSKTPFQTQRVVSSDIASGDYFGGGVYVKDDTAVIGAYGKASTTGAAYIFTRTGSTWAQQAKLVPADAASGDTIGFRSALASNTAIVGSYSDDDNGTNSGSAYVFIRNGTSWSQTQKIKPSDGTGSQTFGFAIDISGNSAIIGAHGNSQAAYIFTNNGGTWTQQAKLTGTPSIATFGGSVAIDGDTAVVGTSGGESVYVFTRSGSTWSQQAVLTVTGGTKKFGYSVSIRGNTILVGARDDSVQDTNSGSAYIFTRSGSTWTQIQKLTASNGAYFTQMGYGAVLDNEQTAILCGQTMTWIFRLSGGTWTEQSKRTGGGRTCSISGSWAAHGWDSDNTTNGTNAGSVTFFTPAP